MNSVNYILEYITRHLTSGLYMTLEDLRTLEIGLELYKRESPLSGDCEQLIEVLLRVVRHDITTSRAEKTGHRVRRKNKSAGSNI